MASENLTMELWEIIQKNNKEKISYNDFENDLNKAFNLPKDEVDRALSIMISQAEVNPNIIGEYKGGSFLISQAFAASITSTIKYENQFIPGKQEYIARENGEIINTDINVVAVGLLSPEIVDKMIADYDKLSDSEQDLLWESYSDMNPKQRKEMDKAHDKALKEKQDSKNTPPEEKKKIGNIRRDNKIEASIIEAAQAGDKGAIKLIREYFKDMKENNQSEYRLLFNGDDIDFNTIDNESIIRLAIAHRGQKEDIQRQANVQKKNQVKVKRFTLKRNGNSLIMNSRNNINQFLGENNETYVNTDSLEDTLRMQKSYGELLTNEVLSDYANTLNAATTGIDNQDNIYAFLEEFVTTLDIEEIDEHEEFLAAMLSAIEKYKGISKEDRKVFSENMQKRSKSIYSAISVLGVEGYAKNVVMMARLSDRTLHHEQMHSLEQSKRIMTDKVQREVIPEEPIKKAFSVMGVDLSFDEEEMARLTKMLETMPKATDGMLEHSSGEDHVKESEISSDESTSLQKNSEEERDKSGEPKESKESDEYLEKAEESSYRENDIVTNDDLFASMSDMLGYISHSGNEEEQNKNNKTNIGGEKNKAIFSINTKIESIDPNIKEGMKSIKSTYDAKINKDGGIVFFNPKAIARVKRRLRPVRTIELKNSQDELVLQLNQQNSNEVNSKVEEEPVQE